MEKKPEWLIEIEKRCCGGSFEERQLIHEKIEIPEELLKDLKCPNCKRNTLVDIGSFWLVEENRNVEIDDCMVRCFGCWNLYTIGYLKKVNDNGLSLQ